MCCGTPLGDILYVTDKLQAVTDNYTALHRLTRELPDAQVQYLLLRFCTACNLVHWLRTVPPDIMAEFAEQYDEEVIRTLEHLLKTKAQDTTVGLTALTPLQLLQVHQHGKLKRRFTIAKLYYAI